MNLFEKFSTTVCYFSVRLLIQAIAMTACDLSASAKPWDVQVKTVKVIFEEFYEQVRTIFIQLASIVTPSKPPGTSQMSAYSAVVL